MNISSLARTLKITPKELLEILPQVGFDIGQKAIKIDGHTSQRIIREWPYLIRRYRSEKQAEKKAKEDEVLKQTINKEVIIPALITVRDFASLINLPVSKVLPELMRNGIFASLNEKIDFETAAIIGTDLGVEVKLGESDNQAEDTQSEKLKNVLSKIKESKPRPPVIVVMGHVDHGKTSLLDAIRNTNVMSGEAGGITQHIGAYQVSHKNQAITFIDTPGHEAFTAMRSRGARVADIAILIVAADDGVKPQTIESYKIIQSAKIPFIVAINKIDKEGADINRVKQELSSQLNISLEDWGGKIIAVPISAKKNQGITELLDMVLLVAEMEAENMKADPNTEALGTVIESHIDKGEGPVATILIQNGTLKTGDQLCVGGQIYGKARSLKNHLGQNIETASPSTPAKIIGLKLAPRVGDIVEAGEGEKIKIKKIRADQTKTHSVKNQDDDNKNIPQINLILKSDVLGSGEAIEESLEKINTQKVRVRIIHRGLGNITEGDVEKAEGANALLIGFNVKTSPQVENLARSKNITILSFNIIYTLLEEIKKRMDELVESEWERVDLGRLKVLAIFRTENDNQIVGGKVLDGYIEKDALIEVLRDKVLLTSGKMTSLKEGKEEVARVERDQECGLRFEGKPIIEVGDILTIYKQQEVK